MDLSSEYIKMANCEEIQKLYPPLQARKGSYFKHPLGDVFIHTGGLEEKSIWLPQQDDLQKMMDIPFNDMLREFYIFASAQEEGYDRVLKHNTFEQLWLMFIMWEKHRAMWTGSEWDRAHWTEKEVKELTKNKR